MFNDICPSCSPYSCICSSHDYMSFIVGKESNEFIGFRNLDNENNCFLSTALQALFNTTAFNQVLYEDCPESPLCIICCLKKLKLEIEIAKRDKRAFIELYSYRDILSTICGSENFGIGELGDSMEAIEILLSSMHCSSKELSYQGEILNIKCQGECHAHFLCNNLLEEIYTCKCGKINKIQNTSNSFIIKLSSECFFKEIPKEILTIFEMTPNNNLEKIYEKSIMKNIIGEFSHVLKEEMRTKYMDINNKCLGCDSCDLFIKKEIFLRSCPKIMIFHIS